MNLNWLNFYMLPLVCLLGLGFELISLITFYKINSNSRLHRRKTIKIYEYLFYYSISNSVILLINILFGIFNCGQYCHVYLYLSAYWMKQFERFAKIFICNTLNTFNILIEFRIALDRYDKLMALRRLTVGSPTYKKNFKLYKGVPVYQISFILLIVSLGINIPYVFIFKVDTETIKQANITTYIVKPHLEALSGQSPLLLKSIAILYFLKDTCCLTFICALNLMISISLRNGGEATKSKKNDIILSEPGSNIDIKLSHNFKSFYRRKERKVSHMILFLSILLLFGNLPETIYRIKRKLSILFFTSFNYLSYYQIISNMVSFVCSYFKLFIYLYFSKTFLEEFKQNFIKCSWICSRRRQRPLMG